jgi:hypothetical protein
MKCKLISEWKDLLISLITIGNSHRMQRQGSTSNFERQPFAILCPPLAKAKTMDVSLARAKRTDVVP